MFFSLDAPAHPQTAKAALWTCIGLANAARWACTSSISASESYPVSVLRPASFGRLALGREDSS
jgi:hypothetical protein